MNLLSFLFSKHFAQIKTSAEFGAWSALTRLWVWTIALGRKVVLLEQSSTFGNSLRHSLCRYIRRNPVEASNTLINWSAKAFNWGSLTFFFFGVSLSLLAGPTAGFGGVSESEHSMPAAGG